MKEMDATANRPAYPFSMHWVRRVGLVVAVIAVTIAAMAAPAAAEGYSQFPGGVGNPLELLCHKGEGALQCFFRTVLPG